MIFLEFSSITRGKYRIMMTPSIYPFLELHKFDVNLLFKAFINFDHIFRQNLFPKLVMAKDNARFRIENSYSNF